MFFSKKKLSNTFQKQPLEPLPENFFYELFETLQISDIFYQKNQDRKHLYISFLIQNNVFSFRESFPHSRSKWFPCDQFTKENLTQKNIITKKYFSTSDMLSSLSDLLTLEEQIRYQHCISKLYTYREQLEGQLISYVLSQRWVYGLSYLQKMTKIESIIIEEISAKIKRIKIDSVFTFQNNLYSFSFVLPKSIYYDTNRKFSPAPSSRIKRTISHIFTPDIPEDFYDVIKKEMKQINRYYTSDSSGVSESLFLLHLLYHLVLNTHQQTDEFKLKYLFK